MANVTVLGGGAVGVCTALYLQRDGHAVTLIDQGRPGEAGASFGNAGLIQCASVVPVATPGILKAVPRMLLDPDQPLVIRWQHLASLMPFLTRFIAAAAPSRVEAISRALATIIPGAYDAYLPLIREAGAEHLVRTVGELHVYETEASYRSARFAHELRRSRGIEVREVPIEELRQIEPALAPIFRRAVHLPAAHQTATPFALVTALAERFAANGGTILQESLQDIEIGPDGPTGIVTSGGRRPVEALVLALGAFSKPWAAKLGSRVPLDSERGYHLMLPQPGVHMRQSIVSGDYRFAIAPMGDQIRLAGTAELARVGAPPDYRRAHRLLPLARRLVPGLDGAEAKPWMGHRPSTPDSLPVICRSPHHASVYFAFGHSHSGLTLAASTGRLVADLVAGRTPPVDMSPFDVQRF